MNNPKISVIMPVYNGEKYLAEAIDSILNQTFIDFEFIIIDDGSTDCTIDIIRKYDDPRIILIINEYNLGIAKSLNKGINLAQGKYIARMDQDDISLYERLAKQIAFLEENPSICVVACRAGLIDSNGNDLGLCLSEPQTIEEIKTQLPKINCIVHPSVMMRADVAKTYQYNEKMVTKRRDYEDYELWLRLISDNHKIAKIAENIIKYRVHSESFMGGIDHNLSKTNIIRTKKNYLTYRILEGKFSWFDSKVTYYMIYDIIYCITSPFLSKLKIYLKYILVTFGKIIGFLYLSRNKPSIILFLSCDYRGGERYLYDLISDHSSKENLWIFCTDKKILNNNLLIDKCSFDISALIKWPIIKYIFIGIISTILNKNCKSIVIGSKSFFFYDLINYLKEGITAIDFLWEIGGGIGEASLSVVDRLNVRIIDNVDTLKHVQLQYSLNKVDISLKERIIFSSDLRGLVYKIILN